MVFKPHSLSPRGLLPALARLTSVMRSLHSGREVNMTPSSCNFLYYRGILPIIFGPRNRPVSTFTVTPRLLVMSSSALQR